MSLHCARLFSQIALWCLLFLGYTTLKFGRVLLRFIYVFLQMVPWTNLEWCEGGLWRRHNPAWQLGQKRSLNWTPLVDERRAKSLRFIFLQCFYIYVGCVFVFTRMCEHAMVHTQISENSLQASVLFFHHENPRYEAQAVRLGSTHLHLPSHLSILRHVASGILCSRHLLAPRDPCYCSDSCCFVSPLHLQRLISILLQISALDRGRRRLSSLNTLTDQEKLGNPYKAEKVAGKALRD